MNGLAGCYVSTIGKPHEYFDLTSSLVRCILVEPQVATIFVVADVGPYEANETTLAEDDYVLEELSTTAADPASAVLPVVKLSKTPAEVVREERDRR